LGGAIESMNMIFNSSDLKRNHLVMSGDAADEAQTRFSISFVIQGSRFFVLKVKW
jgi:hypothetical protein